MPRYYLDYHDSQTPAARKRSQHYLMREAGHKQLAREEARQSFRDEAAEAWRAYERDGLHVTQAELDGWVDSLGSRRVRRAPKWHR